MNPAIFDRPFFEVTLPLMLTIISGVWAFVWSTGRRFDQLKRRFDDLDRRFDTSQRNYH